MEILPDNLLLIGVLQEEGQLTEQHNSSPKFAKFRAADRKQVMKAYSVLPLIKRSKQ